MSKKPVEYERLSTLNLDPLSSKFDNQMYNNALKTGNLQDLDYWHSRVTNSKSYSENFLQEEYRRMFPKYQTMAILDNSITSDSVTGENGVISTTHYSTVAEEILPSKENQLNVMIQSILVQFEFLPEEDKLDMYKITAYYLSISGLLVNIPVLNPHLKYFKQIKYPVIANLTAYIGSRYRSDRLRAKFMKIAGKFFNR